MYEKLFSRNIGLLSEQEQNVLKNSTVAVAGCGGVGGGQAIALARAGVGSFILSNPEEFDYSDRNRQFGCYESTQGKNKAEVTAEIIQDINPYAEIVVEEGIDKDNVERVVRNSDVIIDAIEYFKLEEKIMLAQAARNDKKFIFTSPNIGFGTVLLVFDPDGVSFEEYFHLKQYKMLKPHFWTTATLNYLNDTLYENAIEKKYRPIPSFAPSCFLSAGLLSTELLLFLAKKRKAVTIPQSIVLDIHEQLFGIQEISDNE